MKLMSFHTWELLQLLKNGLIERNQNEFNSIELDAVTGNK